MRFKLLTITTAILLSICVNVCASPTLSKNSTGEDVITLQKKLYLIGYEISEIDGIFGNETERAVLAFQKDKNISATGIVTNVTWRALQEAKPIKGRELPRQTAKINTLKSPKTSAPSKSDLVPYGKTFINGKQGGKIIETAKKYIGVPYVFGGNTPKGFDCSGFLQYVFKENGFVVPRLADEQYMLGKAAKVSQLSAGDLVFFTTYTSGASHCGFYVGDRNFLHASSSRGIRIDSLDSDYWSSRFLGARKIID